MKAIGYEIIDHGYDHAQYFQGQGTAFTGYDLALTGVGDNAKEAYEDAVDQAYMMDIDARSLDRLLPKRPYGIRLRDKVPAALQFEESEIYWYVSILLKVKD